MNSGRKLQETIAKRQIEEVAFRYCRAIDRCDEELLLTTFHEDAEVDMGVFVGPAKNFAHSVMPYMREQLIVAMHRLTNVLIEVDDDHAKVESYMPGCAIGGTPEGLTDFPDVMRYLDRFEKRGGAWRISFRRLVMDWNAGFPATMLTNDVFANMNWGRRDRQDPSYLYLRR
jgi:hypothetical protein